MRRSGFLPLLLPALVACGTPQEQCISAATRDIRTLDRLITEERATLARGYGYETHQIMHHEWQRCDDWVPGTPPRMCFEPVWDTVRRPVAIDPAAERRKLDGLLARREALMAQAGPAIAACKTKYPE